MADTPDTRWESAVFDGAYTQDNGVDPLQQWRGSIPGREDSPPDRAGQ